MPETLLTTRANDQQEPWLIKLLVYQIVKQNDVCIHIQTDTKCDSKSYSICYANFNIFMQYQWWTTWDFSA